MSSLIMTAAAPTFPPILLPSVNIFITLCGISVGALIQWRTQGGISGVQTPRPRNSEGPPKNRAELNPTVKTVKKNC